MSRTSALPIPADDTSGAVPVLGVATLNSATGPEDLVRHGFASGQLDGREPFVRTTVLDCSVAATALLPEHAAIERSYTTDSTVTALARSPHGSLLIWVTSQKAVVSVSAPTDARAESLMGEVLDLAPVVTEPDTVPIRIWHLKGNMSAIDDRRIEAPTWETIARNYPPGVRGRLEQLLRIERRTDAGKLILWHGEPGTGKTTALRSLLREWEPWCAGQYIADPERLFSDPGYISDVLTHPPARDQGPTLSSAGESQARWRLIIAEDSDEYLRTSARRDAGAGLGRLLNLTDGVLGQGFNTLILLTTNEEIHRLHPALIRPGRCLARVEFTTFTPTEAADWLPDRVRPPGQDTTLAELFERRGTVSRIGIEPEAVEQTGVYL